MNIGIDIRPLMSPIRTGVGEYTFELLNAIFHEDTEHQYFLFYNAHGEATKHIPNWDQKNITYVGLNYPNKLFNSAQILFHHPKIDTLITSKIQSKNINSPSKLDLFFSPNPNFTTLTEQTKHIITIHDLSFEFFPEFYSQKQRLWHQLVNPRKQCERAYHILTPSENTKQDLINYYKIPSDKITVIYPGLSETFKEQLIKSPLERGVVGVQSSVKEKYHLPDHFILSFGTIEPRKNILGLIKAFELFKNQEKNNSQLLTQNFQLVIAGSAGWKNKPIFTRINASPYKNSIHLIGSVLPAEKAALYSLAGLFVYPSFYEGFGFPILEAFAAQVPIITSNRSSLPEVSGQHAYLVNPHKSHEITLGMSAILTQEKIKNYFIQNGTIRAGQFTWKKAAEKWLQSIEKI
jgi:glycosyltransferase involved in cell wall biosynthesis